MKKNMISSRLLVKSIAIILFFAALPMSYYFVSKHKYGVFISSVHDRKFNPEDWKRRDVYYHDRKYVVKDLMKNHLLQGTHYNNVAELLGENKMNYGSDSTILLLSYEIEVLYKWFDIDPYKTIYLNIYFSATDSLLINRKMRYSQ